jgi:hypothetical protein
MLPIMEKVFTESDVLGGHVFVHDYVLSLMLLNPLLVKNFCSGDLFEHPTTPDLETVTLGLVPKSKGVGLTWVGISCKAFVIARFIILHVSSNVIKNMAC